MFVTGPVLAAGGSRSLGSPKQRSPYRDATPPDAASRTARNCGFDQLGVAVGAADRSRAQADPAGDKVLWRLLARVPVAGTVPRDTGTGDDYRVRPAAAEVAS